METRPSIERSSGQHTFAKRPEQAAKQPEQAYAKRLEQAAKRPEQAKSYVQFGLSETSQMSVTHICQATGAGNQVQHCGLF